VKAEQAFDVCHEVFRAARVLLSERIPTTQLGQQVSEYRWRPDRRARLGDYVSDFACAGECALDARQASRMVMFRMFYLGGAECERARREMGISPDAWANCADQIRRAVGRELVRRGVYPPQRYFLG
jgi:hypothetical protein